MIKILYRGVNRKKKKDLNGEIMNSKEFIDKYTGNKRNRFNLIKDAFYCYEDSLDDPDYELLNSGLNGTEIDFAKYLYEKCFQNIFFWYEMKIHFNGENNAIKYASRISKNVGILSTHNLRRFFEPIIGSDSAKQYGQLKTYPFDNQVPTFCQEIGKMGEKYTKDVVMTDDLNIPVGVGSKLLIYEIPNCSTTPDLLIFDTTDADFTSFDAVVDNCTGVIEVKATQLKKGEKVKAPSNVKELLTFLKKRSKFDGMLVTTKKYKPIPYWMSKREMMDALYVSIDEITVHDGESRHRYLLDPERRRRSEEDDSLWIRLIINDIGRQILGQLMSVASIQRYRQKELTAYLSLVFCTGVDEVAYAVCLKFKVDCELLKRVNEDIGTRIFDRDIIGLVKRHFRPTGEAING